MNHPDQYKVLVYFHTGPRQNGMTFHCRKLERARHLVRTRYAGKFRTALIYEPANQGGRQLEKYDKDGLMVQQLVTRNK